MTTKKQVIFAAGVLLWLTALIFAGNFDLKISLSVADPMSVFGRIFEIIGEPPAILFTSFNLAICAAHFIKSPHRSRKGAILALLSLIGMVGTAFYTVNATFDYIDAWLTDLGKATLGSLASILTLAITAAIVAFFVYYSLKQPHERLSGMLSASAHCVLAGVLTFCIIWAFKLTWGRVRFRQLTELTQFTPFWHPNGYTGNFSFPSGHTANATVILTSLYHIKEGTRARKLAVPLLAVWVIIVALSRVMVGAHYLSDVLCGAAITFMIVFFCKPKQN